jgi:hypothetical protein
VVFGGNSSRLVKQLRSSEVNFMDAFLHIYKSISTENVQGFPSQQQSQGSIRECKSRWGSGSVSAFVPFSYKIVPPIYTILTPTTHYPLIENTTQSPEDQSVRWKIPEIKNPFCLHKDGGPKRTSTIAINAIRSILDAPGRREGSASSRELRRIDYPLKVQPPE